MKFPIKSNFEPQVSQSQIERAKELAAVIKVEQPGLIESEEKFRSLLVTTDIDDAPTLHLDDFSEIPIIGVVDSSDILQQRARLRAGDGDYVAQSRMIESGFSDYSEYKLGLGRVEWLYPAVEPSRPARIAFECWRDRRVRHDLIQSIRRKGLRYIHPHVSTLYVWELALTLQNSARRPISVIGPTPALAQWANDKIEFAQMVERLFGSKSVPHTELAYNFATLSKMIARFAATHSRIGIKFPYGTGGHGNFLVDAKRVRGKSLLQVKDLLTQLLSAHRWPKKGRVLVDVWESDVIASPSVQTWIPPTGCGNPVIEGLFKQSVEGDQGAFVGSHPVRLPLAIEQKIVDQSYLLTIVFQELGYVGRSSFDLILVGAEIEDCSVEFIECNARWGGTSIPMTLAYRLQLDRSGQTFGVRNLTCPGLNEVGFSELARELEADLYNAESGQGDFVLFNPAGMKAKSAIDVLAVGKSEDHVEKLLAGYFPDRLTEIVNKLKSSSIRLLNHKGANQPPNIRAL